MSEYGPIWKGQQKLNDKYNLIPDFDQFFNEIDQKVD